MTEQTAEPLPDPDPPPGWTCWYAPAGPYAWRHLATGATYAEAVRKGGYHFVHDGCFLCLPAGRLPGEAFARRA